jgi:LSD1 subclass zinc finger protein
MSGDRKLPGRGMPGRGIGDRKSSFARSFFSSGEGNGEEAQLDDSVPVPRSRPLGRLASRRNLSIAKRPSMMSAPSQRGIEVTKSGDSLSSAAASLKSAGRMSGSSPIAAVPEGPPRNAEENWLRQSMMRSSHSSSAGAGTQGGFDMNAIHAALKEDEAMEAGFDDEEVLEQYRIMAQHEATLRVKANIGFDVADYEKRRKASGNDTKDKMEMSGGSKKPNLGLPPPITVSTSSSHTLTAAAGKEMSSPPPDLTQRIFHGEISECYGKYLEEQQKKEQRLPELSNGEKVSFTQSAEGDHVVRCWGCRVNLKVNFVATLVRCPVCKTVSQARNRKN